MIISCVIIQVTHIINSWKTPFDTLILIIVWINVVITYLLYKNKIYNLLIIYAILLNLLIMHIYSLIYCIK